MEQLTLEQKIRDVLARLSTLSEAKASNLEPRTSHGASDSRAPAGVAERRRLQPTDPDRPPPKERSLFDFYVWEFAHADPDDRAELFNLWLLAERDYHARVLHIPRRVAVRSGEDAKGTISGAEAEREAAKRVVELYEGRSAEEAAVFEYTTVGVIHKARKMHKRNTDDGRPRPPFLDWDEDERRRQIELLRKRAKDRNEIMGAKRIAQHFGVALSTVQRYIDSPAVAA